MLKPSFVRFLVHQNTKKKHSTKKSTKILKICNHCGKEYYTWSYQKDSKFCSNDCKHLNGRVEKECIICGKTYTSTKWENEGYCSKKCQNKISVRRKSKFEKIIFDYLDETLIKYSVESNKFIKLNKRQIFPDILINNEIIIDCFGDYWHCNPEFYNKDYFHKQIRKTASEIWKYDNEKEEILKNNGYNVIRVWENDFTKNKITLDNIKNKIYEIYENKKN